MKRFINELVFGKNAKLSGLLAFALVSFIALGCACGDKLGLSNIATNTNTTSSPSNGGSKNIADEPDDSIPSDTVVEALVKDTLTQFSEAIDSGDFSTMHENASEDFQKSKSVSDMESAFATFVDKKKIVVPILNKAVKAKANFTSPASVRTEMKAKVLSVAGSLPAKPNSVTFDFEYVMRGGEWKLLKVIVNVM